jgi:predicted nucleotidyltransferase
MSARTEKDYKLEKDLLRFLPEIRRRWGVESLGYFYDFMDKTSAISVEVNILVTLRKPLGWKFFELKEFLEMKLKRRIDIVTPRGLKTLYREEIEKCVHHL